MNMNEIMKNVVANGGEGIIARTNGKYTPGRSPLLVKIKPEMDAEAIVLSHNMRTDGTLKSLNVEWQKHKFKIGTGFSHTERKNPPKVEDIVTFKYHGYYKSGKPKFAAFLRIRKSE